MEQVIITPLKFSLCVTKIEKDQDTPIEQSVHHKLWAK